MVPYPASPTGAVSPAVLYLEGKAGKLLGDLKLVVFDCDGVLFDSKDANRRYYNSLLEHFRLPEMTAEDLDYVHTHNAVQSTRHIFRNHHRLLEEAEAFRGSLDYTPFLGHMRMMPGLKHFLELVRKRVKTAISTNRTTTMPAVLHTSSLAGYFDVVVTALDVRNPKPHPEALIKILDFFGFRPEEGIFIGDSGVDREHSAAVGMEMIAFQNRALDAEYHADSFTEVSRLPPFRRFS